ncbi:MAG: signal peptidase I [Verrucomicrobiota bacterium]|nr:signal peptidase I [Verrucomicrobiota bacterium]
MGCLAGMRRRCMGAKPEKTLIRVLFEVTAIIFVFHYMLQPIQIIGSSMSPTYQDGSLNLMNRVCYKRTNPNRGDVVVVENEGETLLKRIVAIPGERISIEQGTLRINGHIFENDPFGAIRIPWELSSQQLRANEYFVIGDNRNATVFCKVHKSKILGKVIF